MRYYWMQAIVTLMETIEIKRGLLLHEFDPEFERSIWEAADKAINSKDYARIVSKLETYLKEEGGDK